MKPEYDEERAIIEAHSWVAHLLETMRDPLIEAWEVGHKQGFDDGFAKGREDALAEAFPKSKGIASAFGPMMPEEVALANAEPGTEEFRRLRGDLDRAYDKKIAAKKYGCPKATDD